jgi:hypothetical protein
MIDQTIHNPDRYMFDLRQILSQGRKRIGLLIGAGAPASVKVNAEGELASSGNALIPDVKALTTSVIESLVPSDKAVIENLLPELGENPNIEVILTRVRRLSQAIGSATICGLNADAYRSFADTICTKIGQIVAAELPSEPNSFTELISWIGGTYRDHPIELFTPNYDLLLEEAFERLRLPYFDGFSGSFHPFFDAASISDDHLPPRWSRLWKIHGSLGWKTEGDSIIRTGSREANKLIYPDHLKYDQITKQPYSALFERLHKFLTTPDSLLICTGFSFGDAHISSVLEESLATNKHTAILAFQYRELCDEQAAVRLAQRRPNLSVYARDGAVICALPGKWQPGQPPMDGWGSIQETYWHGNPSAGGGDFLLGDFAKLARFFAYTQAREFNSNQNPDTPIPEDTQSSQSLGCPTSDVSGVGNAQP